MVFDFVGVGGDDGVVVVLFDIVELFDVWFVFFDGSKGMVWLNGFLFGCYWSVGL